MRRAIICLAICCGLGIVSLEASALSNSCDQEANTLCQGITPGEGRLTSCITQNKARFTPQCKPEVFGFLEQRRQFGKSCRSDAKKYCAGTKPGRGQLLSCLALHKEQLSPGCQQQIV